MLKLLSRPFLRNYYVPMNPKRLVFLIVSLSYAGAQTQMLALAKTLKARGWDIKVITMMTPEGQTIVPMLEELNIPWVSLDVARGSGNPFRAMFKLCSILQKWQPTILHSHMIHANILARLVRLVIPVPIVICTAHNTIEGGRSREMIYRFTDFLCDHTTNVSQAAVDRYIKVGVAPKHKISLLRNGIDVSGFLPKPDVRAALRQSLNLGDSFTYLAVGRLDDQKDYDTMLKAFAHARERESQLLIVGEGPHLEKLESLSKELKLETRVHFLGVRRDVPDLMQAADAYLMSSVMEGLPMVLLEAAASALPIITTDVGGNREIVLEDESGFMVPAQDPQALTKAIDKLHHTKAKERKIMGKQGRKYVKETYALEAIVDQWESLYKGWMRQKGIKQVT
jgi:glycosyltransferase involved in cell wall biosynthesis